MVISGKLVFTRKPHICWGCGIKYPAKTSMAVTNHTDDEKLYSIYWCEICDSFQENCKFFEDSDGICMGDFACEDTYKQFKLEYNAKKS